MKSFSVPAMLFGVEKKLLPATLRKLTAQHSQWRTLRSALLTLVFIEFCHEYSNLRQNEYHMSSYFIDPLVDWHLQSCMNLFIRIILNDLQLIWLDLVGCCFFVLPLFARINLDNPSCNEKIESHTTSKVDSIWVIDHAMANLALCMGWFSKDERTFQVGFPHPLNTAGGRRIPLAVGSSHRVPQRSGNWWSGCFSDGSRNKLVCSYLDIYMFISCPDIISCHHHSTIICYMRLYAFWLRGTFAFPLPRRHKTCRSLGLGLHVFFWILDPV